VRSGVRDQLDLTRHHRKLIDLLEMHDWLNEDFSPLVAALTAISISRSCQETNLDLSTTQVNAGADPGIVALDYTKIAVWISTPTE
jgi:hypothetical protein